MKLSIGHAPIWSRTSGFWRPKKSKVSRNALNRSHPPWSRMIDRVKFSAATACGVLSCGRPFGAMMLLLFPNHLTHSGKNSGIFGSKPIRVRRPPSTRIMRRLSWRSCAQFRVESALTLTFASCATLSSTMMVIWFVNSGRA